MKLQSLLAQILRSVNEEGPLQEYLGIGLSCIIAIDRGFISYCLLNGEYNHGNSHDMTLWICQHETEVSIQKTTVWK